MSTVFQSTQLPHMQPPRSAVIPPPTFGVSDEEIPEDSNFDIKFYSKMIMESLQSFHGFKLVDLWRKLEKATSFPGSSAERVSHEA